ncbi:hypothetical protein BST61_g6164 [Cercospora zeina]
MADARSHRSNGRRGHPRASQACVRCRQRKIKCIGLAPGRACESCTSLQVSCTVSETGDGRKHGSRAHFDALQARIRRLESALAQQGQQPEDEPGGTDHFPGNALSSGNTDARESSPIDALNGVLQSFEETDGDATSFYPDEMAIGDESNILVRPRISNVPALASPVSQGAHTSTSPANLATVVAQEQVHSRTRPLEPFDMLATQLTPASEQDDNLDMLLPDGQSRFYGPTSQRYVKDHELYPLDDPEPRNTARTSNPKLDAAPRKDFLLQMFFRAQLLSTSVVNQASFEAGRGTGVRVQRYSRFLENSILACASRMASSHDLRKSGAQYADRARQEILEEISNPNIASLQGFLLLSDFEATRGRNRLGYIYCGIACRLVFDLGLTASCTALVAEGKISTSEAFERHDLLLAAHVFDKLWSMYMGRPSAIPTAMVAVAHQRLLAGGWKGSLTVEHWVGLCTDVSEATELLLTTSSLEPTTVDRLRVLDRRLKQRFDSLPTELAATDLDRAFELSPSAYALNIQFHGAQIVSRGLLKKASESVRPDAQTSIRADDQRESSNLRQPCQEMLANAIAIARLVSTYHDTYGVENIVTVMLDNMYVASAVLVSHVLHNHESRLQAPEASPRSWLETLRNILFSARSSYPVATRMCWTLSKTVQGTILSGVYDDPSTDNLRPTRNGNVTPGLDHLAAALGTSAFRGNTLRLEDPTCTFDNDPMLGNMFADELTMDAEGNLMDWLALGLETDKNVNHGS